MRRGICFFFEFLSGHGFSRAVARELNAASAAEVCRCELLLGRLFDPNMGSRALAPEENLPVLFLTY